MVGNIKEGAMITIFSSHEPTIPKEKADCTCHCRCVGQPGDYGIGYLDGMGFGDFYHG